MDGVNSEQTTPARLGRDVSAHGVQSRLVPMVNGVSIIAYNAASTVRMLEVWG